MDSQEGGSGQEGVLEGEQGIDGVGGRDRLLPRVVPAVELCPEDCLIEPIKTDFVFRAAVVFLSDPEWDLLPSPMMEE